MRKDTETPGLPDPATKTLRTTNLTVMTLKNALILLKDTFGMSDF